MRAGRGGQYLNATEGVYFGKMTLRMILDKLNDSV
jgi:hypothetical protein